MATTQPRSPGSFPSLRIGADRIEPHGPFAESQAAYLKPDPALVRQLDEQLRQNRMGVVAHFYMDPELQGALSSCEWPHVHVSDSLAMADKAIEMARHGAERIMVLGVDFMSENVRAMLDAAGFEDVPVYRASAQPIGCSLAESAEARAYGAWLTRASKSPDSLHVIYINTSLRVKAKSHALVPTITCTSSNVVPVVLQAFAQVPDAHVWFGPDTYMGHNLQQLFESLAELGDAQIRELHPQHDRSTVRQLAQRFRYFEQGTCIVHHMFGRDVAERVRRDYPDAYVTAHLEVPGEMFTLGLEGQRRGEGVVGSTSNILGFIGARVEEAAQRGEPARLQFVLGTEAGMITPIVRQTQQKLRAHRDADVEVEIVFPVASEAVAETSDAELGVVPGVAGGEGCSTAGGCATCPYMKMNSLDALFGVLERVAEGDEEGLRPFAPHKYTERVAGRTMADLGGEPILHMREFQRTGRLPPALVQDMKGRHAGATSAAAPAR
jgi:quinolinate synthase